MTTPIFSEYARYYDLLNKDKDYRAEAEYVHCLIQRYRPETLRILELGSGTGRHAVLLSEHGYRVHGIERSEEMLAQAQYIATKSIGKYSQGLSPTFSLGDIKTSSLENVFDTVISLFHVISYQTSNSDLAAAFQTARRHLDKGGVFIFDVWYGPCVLAERPTVRIKRMADEHVEVIRFADPIMRPNDNIVEVNYNIFIRNRKTNQFWETAESHYMRYVFQPEIAMLAEHFGLLLEHGEEWMTGNPLGFKTWGACFILRAV